MDAAGRLAELSRFVAGLTTAVGVDEFVAASDVPAECGLTGRFVRDLLWVGDRRITSPIPRLVLEVAPPLEAAALCEALGIADPVAVSGDTHQNRWQVLVTGPELPDPYGRRRIAVDSFRVGRWVVVPELEGRPAGPVPETVAGASPAYDVRERGGAVSRIEVARAPLRAALVAATHPDAAALLAAMADAYPAWHAGWELAPDAEMALVYQDGAPAAGAALASAGTLSIASRFCAPSGHGGSDAGSALLDVLEALALDRGCDRLRLEDSAFLLGARVPFRRHGYRVGPPYRGDADEAVSAERVLDRPGTPLWSAEGD